MPLSKPSTPGLRTFAFAAVLIGFLAAAVWFAIYAWTGIEGPPIPTEGYVAMTLGVLFSLIVGITLMALLFYSSRHGYDQPPDLTPTDER